MDRLSRFRRSKRDAAEEKTSSSGSRTPSPQALAPPGRPREKQSRSPFRGLHIRASAKRARESPPASLPHSPTAAIHLHEDLKALASSPLSTKSGAVRGEAQHDRPKPKIPSFLTLSSQEIEGKFQELIWLERNRMMQSISNPSPDFRWARVSGPHLKALDRYTNVQPWHNNRVKLKVPPGQVDYINASPIELATSAPSPDRYIAMQGPKQVSSDHVWRMVVEQLRSPAVIVMLTETHEAHMEKCFPYFPRAVGELLEINADDEFGDGFRASVRCEGTEDTPAGDAIELRRMVVQVYKRRPRPHTNGTNGSDMVREENGEDVVMKSPSKKPDLDVAMKSPGMPESQAEESHYEDPDDGELEVEEERVVYHFLYKRWPDFGVPALEDLESFFTLMRLSREKNADAGNPRIVHCSAGVGRTGTFMALEHLMRELDAGVLENYDVRAPSKLGPDEDGDVDGEIADGQEQDDGGGPAPLTEAEGEDLIFTTVNQLREQRRTMVQAESQYLFVYQVLRRLWQDKYGVAEEGGEPAAKRLEVDPFIEE